MSGIVWEYAHIALSITLASYVLLTWWIPLCIRFPLDCLYICMLFMIFIHWFAFRNDCIISFYEKKSIHSAYRLGQCPDINPFKDAMSTYVGSVTTHLIQFAPLLNAVIVISRWPILFTFKILILTFMAIPSAYGFLLRNTYSNTQYCKELKDASKVKWS